MAAFLGKSYIRPLRECTHFTEPPEDNTWFLSSFVSLLSPNVSSFHVLVGLRLTVGSFPHRISIDFVFFLFLCYIVVIIISFAQIYQHVLSGLGMTIIPPPSPSGRGGGIIDSFPSISFSFFKYIFCSFLH